MVSASRTSAKSRPATTSAQPATGKASLTDAATKLLRDNIVDLTLAPGQRIDEKFLREKFGISRTPVREALNRLSAEGLVEVRSNLGAYVAPMSLKHTMDLLTAYVLCERMVASVCNIEEPNLGKDLSSIQDKYERVAERRDLLRITELNSRFHGRIAAASKNQFIIQYCADLHNLARRISFFVYQREQEMSDKFDFQLSSIISQHHEIIDAVSRRDKPGFIEICTAHAAVFRQRLRAIIGDNVEADIDFESVIRNGL